MARRRTVDWNLILNSRIEEHKTIPEIALKFNLGESHVRAILRKLGGSDYSRCSDNLSKLVALFNQYCYKGEKGEKVECEKCPVEQECISLWDGPLTERMALTNEAYQKSRAQLLEILQRGNRKGE